MLVGILVDYVLSWNRFCIYDFFYYGFPIRVKKEKDTQNYRIKCQFVTWFPVDNLGLIIENVCVRQTLGLLNRMGLSKPMRFSLSFERVSVEMKSRPLVL